MSGEKYSNGTKAIVDELYADLTAREQNLIKRIENRKKPYLQNKKTRSRKRLVWAQKSEGKSRLHALDFDDPKDQRLILDWYYHECLDRVRGNLRLIDRNHGRFINDRVEDVAKKMVSKFDELDIKTLRELLIKDGITHMQKLSVGEDFAEDAFGNRLIETENGKFRSKSEALIAARLDYYGVIYKYEQSIKIRGITFVPDFLIFKNDGTILMWEHMGMLDDVKYRNKQIKKIKEYMDAGYFPWDGLILTSETEGKIVDIKDVDQKIKSRILK